MTRLQAAAAAALGAALVAIGGSGMAADMVLASPIEGRVVRADGAPAADLRLTRTWRWAFTGREGADETRTDAEGRFALPEVTGSSFLASVIPHEPSVGVELAAEGPRGPVTLLSLDKRDYALGAEAARIGAEGPALRVVCDLDAEPGGDGVYWGTCRLAD